MTDAITKALEETKVVPLVRADDPKTAVKISEALIEGGLSILEVAPCTNEAVKRLEAISIAQSS